MVPKVSDKDGEEIERICCELCGKTFKAPYLLKRHIREDHEKGDKGAGQDLKKYPCPSCDLVFDNYFNMNRDRIQCERFGLISHLKSIG